MKRKPDEQDIREQADRVMVIAAKYLKENYQYHLEDTANCPCLHCELDNAIYAYKRYKEGHW